MNTLNRFPVSTNVLLSLVTSPFLLGLVAYWGVTHTLQELGQASEEVFRGDRLPILPVPASELEASEPPS